MKNLLHRETTSRGKLNDYTPAQHFPSQKTLRRRDNIKSSIIITLLLVIATLVVIRLCSVAKCVQASGYTTSTNCGANKCCLPYEYDPLKPVQLLK